MALDWLVCIGEVHSLVTCHLRELANPLRGSPFLVSEASADRVSRIQKLGIPWRSSGWDSALSLPRAWVQSLVGELRSCEPCGPATEKEYRKCS